MFVAVLVLGCLLAAVLLFSGARKVAGGQAVAGEAAHLGVPLRGYRLIGVVEAAAAAGLLIGLAWAALGVVAAAGVVLLMCGAVVFHLRAGDAAGRWAPAAVLAVLAVVTLLLRVASA
ncbi:DoxX-like family protein [Lentzea xinjiangensis]|uniref:DoxX-like family protein n=1 Tax=Lentzea xinjiangensis TaxID=402600 RepID=A0A1H9NL81_9PSEU|nr:DoxX-like family protein [Lentzea xinjiangensis]